MSTIITPSIHEPQVLHHTKDTHSNDPSRYEYVGRNRLYKAHIAKCDQCGQRPLNLCATGLRYLKFGNPFEMGLKDGFSRDQILDKFLEYFVKRMSMPGGDVEFHNAVMALKGKDLGCWCRPLKCHASVYLKVANSEEPWPKLLLSVPSLFS